MEGFILVLACAGACYLMMSILKLAFWLTDLYFDYQIKRINRDSNDDEHLRRVMKLDMEVFKLKKEVEELKK